MGRNRIILMIIIIMALLTASAAAASGQDTFWITGEIRYSVAEETYGILSNDGKKYQPVKLSKEFRKAGLAVVCKVRLRDDLIGARMWGRAVEVIEMSTTSNFVATAERQAMVPLLIRMDAFNTRNLEKLQAVDVVSRGLAGEQFNEWVGTYGNFTLRYVEIQEASTKEIKGICLYSRELQNGLAMSGNIKYSIMEFTLNMLDGSWKITSSGNYKPADSVDMEEVTTTMLERAKTKYKTDNLANWRG